MDSEAAALRKLARLYGVQTAYHDIDSLRQTAPTETLVAVLQALGAPLALLSDAPAAVRETQQAQWRTMLHPVVVAWEGATTDVILRLPEREARDRLRLDLTFEDGTTRSWSADLRPTETRDLEGVRYVTAKVALRDGLPLGYHTLRATAGARSEQCMVISAPLRAYQPERAHQWGVFAPLYALHSARSWGIGDFTDLRDLATWLGELGATDIATLPFLASTPDEASPYAPLSRLFWNEAFVDVTALGGDNTAAPNQIARLRSSELIDYERIAALKRRVLEQHARAAYDDADRWERVEAFADALPQVRDYARFRAVWQAQQTEWPDWPDRLRRGGLRASDCDPEVERYHLFAQQTAEAQVQQLVASLDDGQRLYVDLPIGVHPTGFDTWREQDTFVEGISVGAPPDKFFATGQNWGFPPLHLERIRRHGYRYVIDYLRRQMNLAGMLRIDHVMGLHRLFWIPRGSDAAHGAYVRQRPEELYAIIALESHRTKTPIVGENLGTVPRYVNAAMRQHGIQRMRVLQFELADSDGAIPRLGHNDVASLNTHDMAPFAAYWNGTDLDTSLGQHYLDSASAAKEREDRARMRAALSKRLGHRGEVDVQEALTGLLRTMAQSNAGTVLVNLEDLWLEERPQNIPGTIDEYPNWRRKLRSSLEELRAMPALTETLREVNRLRKRGSANKKTRQVS